MVLGPPVAQAGLKLSIQQKMTLNFWSFYLSPYIYIILILCVWGFACMYVSAQNANST